MPKPRDICSKPDARRRLLSGGDELLKKNGQTRVEKTQCPKTNLLDLSDRTRVAGFLFPAVSDSADANIELFYDSGRSEKVEDVTKSTSNSIEFKCSDDLCCKSVKTLRAKVNGEEWTVIFILYNCIKHLDLNQLNAATGRKYDTALAAVVVCVLIIH